jgi:hypothetical protein
MTIFPPRPRDCWCTGLNRSLVFVDLLNVSVDRVTAALQTHDEPWLHVPCPAEGQPEKSHTRPQAPQLFGSVCVLTHWLLQAVPSGGRHVRQLPVEQTSFEPQVFPHVPQLRGSF